MTALVTNSADTQKVIFYCKPKKIWFVRFTYRVRCLNTRYVAADIDIWEKQS
jgi:hypothetical protein